MLFAAATILLLINALAPALFQDIAQKGFPVSALNLFGISAVFPIAGYALWAVGSRQEEATASRADWVVVTLAVAAALVPIHLAAKAALLPLSIYLVATSKAGDSSRGVGAIGLALCGAFIVGAIVLDVFAGPLLALDGLLVEATTGASVKGNLVSIDPRSSGVVFEKIVIMRDCSSVRNVSQAVILWASLVVLLQARVTRAVLISGLLTMAVMVALNVIRIALIVTYPEHLAFIHEGLGATAFSLAALVAGLAIIGSAIVAQVRTLED